MVDITNHNNIPEELIVMYFIVFSFIITGQFCIPNVILICFLLVAEWLIGKALWKASFAHA